MNSLNIRSLQDIFGKKHTFIFGVFIIILVLGAVFSLYQIFDSSLAQSQPAKSTIANFDQKTIDRIKELRDSSDDSNELTFPENRENPFVN